jgi:hypothetical protein
LRVELQRVYFGIAGEYLDKTPFPADYAFSPALDTKETFFMAVTGIVINTGNLPRQAGFGNPRLDNTLGIINQGAGQRFGYAFQIQFDLEGISGHEVKLMRRVTHKNDYTQNRMRTAQQVIDAYNARELLGADPGGSEDSPNPGNIYREEHRVVVQDGPGPSFGIGDATMYPMRFEGKFILMLKDTNNVVQGKVEYYVRLLKRQMNGQVEGEFVQRMKLP